LKAGAQRNQNLSPSTRAASVNIFELGSTPVEIDLFGRQQRGWRQLPRLDAANENTLKTGDATPNWRALREYRNLQNQLRITHTNLQITTHTALTENFQ